MPIHCLAFCRIRAVARTSSAARPDLVGCWHRAQQAVSLIIWDVGAKIPRSHCHGSVFDVYAVAFSPDGSTLASAGRTEPKLWDVATGRLLLSFPREGNVSTGLALFSDGRKLAITNSNLFGHLGRVDVWELDKGRGIQTLRGLVGQIAQVRLSQDGRYLARSRTTGR